MSYDQTDAHIELRETSQPSSETSSDESVIEIEVYEISPLPSERPHGSIAAQTAAGGSSQQTTKRPQGPTEVEIEVGESSKRPRLEEKRPIHPGSFTYKASKHSPQRATRASSIRSPSLLNYGCGPSACRAVRPSNSSFDRGRLLDPRGFLTRQQENLPSNALPTSLQNSIRRSNPNFAAPSRPSFAQLAADGQQGMKVLFFIDHATKGDAIHYNIRRFVNETSLEMKHLMSKYRSDRSSFQNRFFSKARAICAQLTSRHVFEMEALESNRAKRLAYFSDRCTDAYLSTVYSQIASAVDIPKILAARTPHHKAFKNLMTQVFIHSMEDLWCFEFHPSKQDISAKLEKENKEDVYNRFKILTDPVNGLPAARDMPGYLDVPLRADFPRYVLFSQSTRLRNEEDIYESDEGSGNEDEGGDIPHPWIPAE